MADEDGVVVEYKINSDPEGGNVDVKSPAKNRFSGTKLSLGEERRKSSVPVLFERASKSWWNPRFDSNLLENQYQTTTFAQTKRRFQIALVYILISCVAWCVFFGLMREVHWVAYLVGTIALLVIIGLFLGFSFTQTYARFVLPVSVVITLILCSFGLLSFVYDDPTLSAVGTFTASTEILLMMYTVIPLPLYVCVILGFIYSITYELLSALFTSMNGPLYIVGRVLLHIAIHLIGIHIFIMSQARKRSTFLKVCQSVMSRRDLEFEKQLKQKMINSLMPKQVADEVMRSKGEKDKEQEEIEEAHSKQKRGSDNHPEKPISFRSFHMSQMDNVSILFADIVGFTKMSSNKTAEHLVFLLNELFGRFDILCNKCGAEKISTLGDCYYCVSGCPEPRPDHARCCVELGLAMCKAIKEFDEDYEEQVNMRVGVHTGTVLCGLVGTRRFKFDVWSHDVTLANTMESEGRPGTVHIANSTYKFIKDDYEVEEGEHVPDIRMHKVLTESYDTETQKYIIKHIQDKDTIATWFIKNRKWAGETVTTYSDEQEREQQKAAYKAQPHDIKIEVEAPSSIEASVGEEKVSIDKPDASPASPSNSQLTAKTQTNHCNDEQTRGSGRDLTTASLLGKRENIATSLEDLVEKGESSVSGMDTGLMTQIQSQRIHEQSDKQLIRCLKEGEGNQDYLYRPPINLCTLNFEDPNRQSLERRYRAHYLKDSPPEVLHTFSAPLFSTLCDLVVSLIFMVLISICCFLGFTVSTPLVVVFVAALIIEVVMLVPVVIRMHSSSSSTKPMMLGKCVRFFNSWYPRHVFGAVLASLPALLVYSNFSCAMFATVRTSELFYCMLLIAALLHYCNFTMLSSWMKSTLATLAGVMLLILMAIGVCQSDLVTDEQAAMMNNMSTSMPRATADYNTTMNTTMNLSVFSGNHSLKFEIILNMILFLVLIWFLNREFEISYRLSFHGDQQASIDRLIMNKEKEQADWLLHNIIPEHVASVLKKTSKYCQNHKDVGVVFAKVVNFDDFYDESFEGGREYLRVLNELMGDFEDLFDDPKYKDVEKIKTIGSCLMAASGLNLQTRNQNKDPNAHLYALMDFCVDLLAKLEDFNAEIFNFDFEMSIGFNHGEVTSGVIGTTKLLYDIWGDTVNVSSRMYSTGVPGRIQVTEECSEKVAEMFEFEYRGKTFVKGKGDLNTYLIVKRKPGSIG